MDAEPIRASAFTTREFSPPLDWWELPLRAHILRQQMQLHTAESVSERATCCAMAKVFEDVVSPLVALEE